MDERFIYSNPDLSESWSFHSLISRSWLTDSLTETLPCWTRKETLSRMKDCVVVVVFHYVCFRLKHFEILHLKWIFFFLSECRICLELCVCVVSTSPCCTVFIISVYIYIMCLSVDVSFYYFWTVTVCICMCIFLCFFLARAHVKQFSLSGSIQCCLIKSAVKLVVFL